jgi:hypothetical protein
MHPPSPLRRIGVGDSARLTLLASALVLPGLACAAPLLRCEISYGGTTRVVEAAPTVDPYRVRPIDIGGRFRFKAVVTGTDQRIDLVKLYAYYHGKRQPILLQEARYAGPFVVSDSAYALTGLNHLYAPPLGRELQYGCAIVEAKS